MSSNSTLDGYIRGIRSKALGEEVREDIALALELIDGRSESFAAAAAASESNAQGYAESAADSASAAEAAEEALENAIDATLTEEGHPADAKAVGDALVLKAPLASPALTGTPTAPTPDIADDSTQIATTAYVAKIGKRAEAAFVENSAVGSIITIPDGADGLPMASVAIDIPVTQDLHGLPYPWPAGGGKNMLDPDTISEYSTHKDFYEDSPHFTFPAAGTYTLSSNSQMSKIFLIRTDELYTAYETDTESFTFTITSGDEDELSVSGKYRFQFYKDGEFDGTETFQLEKGSSATDYVPYAYENVCPITGYTGLKVIRAGKNVFDESNAGWVNGSYIDNSGSVQTSSNYKYSSAYTPVRPGKWTLSYQKTSTGNLGITVALYDADKVFIRRILNGATTNVGTITFTFDVPTGAAFIRIAAIPTSNNATNVMIESGELATEYEAFVAKTEYLVNWTDEAGTVYGGTLDVVTGVLSTRWAGVDLANLTWTYDSTNLYQRSTSLYNNSNFKKIATITTGTNPRDIAKAEKYAPVTQNEMGNSRPKNSFSVSATGTITFVNAEGHESETPSGMFVYRYLSSLDTTEYQLTPQQITSLLGGNTVWSDVGTVTVVYDANNQTTFDRLISALPDQTAEGTSAVVENAIAGLPVRGAVVTLPYDANGYTGITVRRAGKNVFEEIAADLVDGKRFDMNGGIESKTHFHYWSTYCPIAPGRWTLSFRKTTASSLSARIAIYDADKNFIRISEPVVTTTSQSMRSGSFTVNAGEAYFRLSVCDSYSPMIERGETRTEYETYNAETYTADWSDSAGIIYGGTLNLLTGVLTSSYGADGTAITPVTYQLDLMETAKLDDVSLFSTTDGSVEVVYKTDVKSYVEGYVDNAIAAVMAVIANQ